MDRDGTVSHEVGYINHVSRMRPYSFTPEAIRLIREAGLLAVLVTNQAGVARGYFEEDMVHRVHDRLQGILALDGTRLDGIYYCPHHPSAGEPPYRANCNCRKPRPGMLMQAVADLDIDLENSFMVGDKISDVEMALDMGLTGILVKTGYGRGELEHQSHQWRVQPHFIAENLLEAAKWIIRN